MKKLFLITIILLLQSFSAFGSPKDKGLVCKCKEYKDGKGCPYIYPIRVFLFNDDDVVGSYFTKSKDIIKVNQNQKVRYYLTATHINWYSKSDDLSLTHTLNRKTLKLLSTNSAYFFISDCKLFEKQNYKNKLQSIRKKLQSDYDNKRKDNKI